MSSEQRETGDWQGKYYAALGELETRERTWTATEQFLRQGLSRLSFVVDTANPVLNRQLEELRVGLRSQGNQDHLSALLDAIAASIRQPAGPELAPPAPAPGFLRRFFPSLDRTAPGPTPAMADGHADPLALAKRLLAELVEAIVPPGAEREALLQRLAGCDGAIALHNLGHELVLWLQPRLRRPIVNVPVEGPGFEEALLQLIERIDVPSDLAAKSDTVKSMLSDPQAPPAMETAITAIVDLCGDMHNTVQHEKDEIQTFLQQMSDRLREIDVTFEQSVATQRASFEEGQALDETVNVQVREIEVSVSQALALAPLKVVLQQRVDIIRDRMHHYRVTEEHRLQQAEQQVRALNERLQSVQQESETLRRRLKEERDLALIDPLTGIPNRFAYNERLQQEVARWRRYRSPLVLAFWDVDNFKRINDTYGHQAGDKVLALIAKLFRGQVRETDFVARYGGEEFVLLLPETAIENAGVAVELIRKSIETCGFHFRSHPVPVTISCGMSQFREGDTPEQVFARADTALYQAKASGRNCICVG